MMMKENCPLSCVHNCYVFLHFFKNAWCLQTKSQKSFKFSISNIYPWYYNRVKFCVNDLKGKRLWQFLLVGMECSLTGFYW